MKAIVYRETGDAAVVALEDVPPPALKEGQVRISVRASGVNRADIAQRLGRYPPPPGESAIPGLEVSGLVTAVGEGARRFKTGEPVMALLGGGGYAEEVCVDEGLCLPLPDGLSFEQGAAIPEAFVTAHHNLIHLAGVGKGMSALIHAGASGVGTAAIQLVCRVDANAYATAGTPEKTALCRKLGAVAIDYKREDFAAVVLAATGGRGVDAVLDPVGASNLDADFRCMAVGAGLVLIGTMGGKDGRFDISSLLRKRHRVIGSTLRGLPLSEKRAAVERFRSDFFGLLSAGHIAPVMDRVYKAASARQAQERMEANLNHGKIVLTWG
ncbi:MAG: NAD(P)H-quinone oxidoreductase [Elusimicrobiota bacterium]